ncbi:hypothetical protein CPB83DRAFT_855628 [Crepidotus variabilis]|uniref:Homeobox domain-containing protein n=1 Tax=Crepidotus variabilis TaxID=179855 RepID=A0A9P6EF58_9AGAR|nr:hypothetical protein CPB83DRAFT_855628 [Crepidotus variabilis]
MSAPQTTFTPPSSPLHLLAKVASEAGRRPPQRSESPMSDSSAGPASLHSRSSSDSTTASYMTNADHLHIPSSSKRLALQIPRPLTRLNLPSPLQSTDPNFVPYIRPRKRSRKPTDLTLKMRMQMKARRKELMEKASKIKSLDNSPVNERQLLVLRMVYDEITMYPCESWMVLVAIIIHRAYKQVKNWFSNERQKNRNGESIPCETEDGDKVRLRASALTICPEWSDTFFEEVVMIYNYKIQRNSQAKLSVRRPTRNSDQ